MECLSCGFPLEHCILFYSFVVILIVALIFFMSLLLHWKLELTSAEVLRYGLNSLIVEMCQSGFHGEFCYSSLVDGDREFFGSKEISGIGHEELLMLQLLLEHNKTSLVSWLWISWATFLNLLSYIIPFENIRMASHREGRRWCESANSIVSNCSYLDFGNGTHSKLYWVIGPQLA